MLLGGTWRIKFDKSIQGIYQKIYDLFSFFLQLYFTVFVTCLFIELPIAWRSNMNQAMANIGMSTICLIIVLKMRILQRHDVVKLLKTFLEKEEDLQKTAIEEDNKIYRDNASYMNKFNLCLMVYTHVCVGVPLLLFSYMANVQLEEIHKFDNITFDRPLPYVTWFPFDPNQHYLTAYVFHVGACALGCTYNITTYSYFITLMSFVTTRLKILQNRFKKFDQYQIDDTLEETATNDGKQLLTVLRSIIVDHQSIIE